MISTVCSHSGCVLFWPIYTVLGAGVAQSVCCLTTDWTTGVRSPTEAEDFSSSLCVQTGSGAHPASCTMVPGVLSPGGKAWSGRDADYSSPSSAEGSLYLFTRLFSLWDGGHFCWIPVGRGAASCVSIRHDGHPHSLSQ
jgi:hypothetical protein